MRSSKAILLAASLLIAPAAIAQTPPDTSAPTLKVYSRETIVDTTVTDAKGQPIHGLLKPDFTLKEDNKPQPIRGFHEYATQPVTPLPKLPPNVYTNLQPPAPSSAINILWLDFTNLAPVLSVSCCDLLKPPQPFLGPKNLAAAMAVQHRVKQNAMDYLKGMPAGTRVAVFGTSFPGKLHLVQGVTSDPTLLSAAIDRVAFNTDGRVELATDPADLFKLTWCPQQEQRNQLTLEALNQMAADMAGIKGRKNLVWFTHGIPTITDPAQRAGCLSDYSNALQKAYGLLTAAQVTVYPVGASGVPGPGDPPDDWLAMEAVAEATGGAAFYNNNDIAAQVGKAIAAGSDYYTLTYVPPGTEYDGRHHTINLKLNQDPAPPGVHLTYRDGYYAEDPTKITPTPGLILAASLPTPKPGDKTFMGRSMPTSTDLLFDVQVEPTTEPAKPTDPPVMGTLDPKLKSKPLTRYSFEYVMPARQIAFAAAGAVRKGSLEFDIAVYDAEDKLVTSLSQSINLPITETQYQQLLKGPFRFFQQLDLPAGAFFLRIGILDTTSNKAGTLEIPLTVPKK